jgi:diaminopimelate decarboxylase
MSKKAYVPPTIERNVSGLMNKYGAGRTVQPSESIGGISVEELVKEHGSPLFVYQESVLRDQHRSAVRAFSKRYPKVRFAWSYKTNYLSAICRVFHSEGSWAEVVSGFEYEKARKIGIPGDQIIFNGPYKDPASLRRAVTERAKIHIDNLDELLALEELADEMKRKIEVGIRVNMDVGIYPMWTKFGFNFENGDTWRAIKRICTGDKLSLTGLHTHIGTFVLDPNCYAIATNKIMDLADAVRSEYKIEVAYVDMGGGFASRSTLHSAYLPGEHTAPSFDQYAEAICNTLHARIGPGRAMPMLFLETGRALCDEAGSLVTSVVAIKKMPDGARGVFIDAGVNLLYTATWYRFNVKPAVETLGNSSPAILYGPLCMNIDVVREAVPLPPVSLGDHLIISPVGAYNLTQSMQFIYYRPRVVMIGLDGNVHVIRDRENLDHVEALERTPEHLKQPAAIA